MRKWFATVIMVLSSVVYAEAGEFSIFGEITEVYTGADWTMVRYSGSAKNPSGCEGTAYYSLNLSHANYEGVLSSILAAQMAKKKVRFWLSGCGGQNGKYPKIMSIQVKS